MWYLNRVATLSHAMGVFGTSHKSMPRILTANKHFSHIQNLFCYTLHHDHGITFSATICSFIVSLDFKLEALSCWAYYKYFIYHV
jgi:hypothetical protein